MDLTRRNFHAMILYDYKKGLTADECFNSLTEAFGGSAPLRATVGNYFREFRIERQSLEDVSCKSSAHLGDGRKRCGVRKLIIEDPHITYHEIEATLEIRSTAKIPFYMSIYRLRNSVLDGYPTV